MTCVHTSRLQGVLAKELHLDVRVQLQSTRTSSASDVITSITHIKCIRCNYTYKFEGPKVHEAVDLHKKFVKA